MKGQAVVSCDNLHILYVGLKNPVTIAVPGIKSEKILVKATNATISGDSGHYFISPVDNISISEVIIEISYRKGLKIVNAGQIKFRIKRVPKPIVLLGYEEPGYFTKSQMTLLPVLRCVAYNFPFKQFYWTVDQFDIALFSNRVHFTHTNKSQILDDFSKNIIFSAEDGDIIVIDNVKYHSSDGKNFCANEPSVFHIGYDPSTRHEDSPYDTLHDYPHSNIIRWDNVYGASGTSSFRYTGKYVSGLKDSIWTAYITSGCGKERKIAEDFYFKDRLLKSLVFSDEGTLKRVLDYKDNFYSDFYPNGKVQSTGQFEMNSGRFDLEELRKPEELKVAYRDTLPDLYFKDSIKLVVPPTGEWNFFYPNGQLEAKGFFAGASHRKYYEDEMYIDFSEHPDIKRKDEIIVRDGLWQFYSQDGKLLREINYDKGKSVNVKIY